MKILQILLLAPLLLGLTACGEAQQTKAVPVYDNLSEGCDTDDAEAEGLTDVAVPFTVQGGVKLVDVTINGLPVKMIVDTGCSSTLISIVEALYLRKNGLLDDEDFLGVMQSQIADGSIVENQRVRLRQVVIGDKITATDVEAVVSDNLGAPLLLGNEVLDRVGTLKIDNENHLLHFYLSND